MDREFIGKGIPFDPIGPEELDSGRKSSSPQTPADGAKDKNPQKKGPSIITVLLVVFMIASLSGAGILYFLKENEVNRRLAVEKKLEQAETDYKDLGKELKDTVRLKGQLEADLARGLENYRRLEDDYKNRQSENEKLSNKLESKIKDIASLKAQLEKETSASTKVSTKLERVSRDYDDIKAQLSQIRMAKEALENRIIQMSRKNRRDSVELERIIVDSDQPLQAAPEVENVTEAVTDAQNKSVFIPLGPPARIEGQVLVVNKEFAFVVINIGEKDGIKSAEVLDVYRGRELMGKVQVERIYDTMSSAIIIPKETKKEIKEGDSVKVM
ncbi:MAG: hypothetical protein L6416_02500 [Candidatus Omnitrophica bacterium]|nr:hypothetical protein [Candidatus Omnitrophota bacterium]